MSLLPESVSFPEVVLWALSHLAWDAVVFLISWVYLKLKRVPLSPGDTVLTFAGSVFVVAQIYFGFGLALPQARIDFPNDPLGLYLSAGILGFGMPMFFNMLIGILDETGPLSGFLSNKWAEKFFLPTLIAAVFGALFIGLSMAVMFGIAVYRSL